MSVNMEQVIILTVIEDPTLKFVIFAETGNCHYRDQYNNHSTLPIANENCKCLKGWREKRKKSEKLFEFVAKLIDTEMIFVAYIQYLRPFHEFQV